MRLSWLPIAIEEHDQAVAFYEERSAGLGERFEAEASRAIELIREYPRAWHPVSARARRCRLNRFPYGIVYWVGVEELLIVAVAHSKRRPRYWQARVPG